MGVTLTEHRKEYACGWWKPYQTPNLGLGPSSTNASPTAPLYPGWWYDVRELVRFRYQGWCSLFDTAAEPSPWHVASERSFYKPLERRLWRRGGQRMEGHYPHPKGVDKGPMSSALQWALSRILSMIATGRNWHKKKEKQR